MIRELKIADWVTLGNLVSGLLSIYFAINHEFVIASLLIFLGMFFDYFDGYVARWLKQQNKFGLYLDSFADSITFGVSIAVLLYMKYQNDILGVILILFACSGVLRLTRYNTSNENSKKAVKYFEGTPITINGFVFPVLVLLDASIYLSGFAAAVLTITMISRLRIPHL